MEYPPSEEMGDIAFPCFSLAKTFRKAPPVIAAELGDKMETDELIEKIEPNGPYINFFINKPHLVKNAITEISSKGANYGKDTIGLGKTVIIEYSSPNIAKPFGIGHLRSTVIGAALRNIYNHLGFNVVGINHLGDWGTQFGKLLYAFKEWGDEKKLKADPIGHLFELYVKIHKEEEADPGLADKTRAEFKKLEGSEPVNIALWKMFSEFSKSEFDRIYKMLGIEFDSQVGESFYVDKMKDVESNLEKASLLKESQEATIVDLEKYDMPPMLIRKSDDTSLYATRDLAAARVRKENYYFHKMCYVPVV